ncbi:putative pentatricopeptide repeat-containing protein At1g02420 [Nymphaea colorata]|uniref:putative pentatricopeptide repeat-containing protein At1g02420 n=1 Tax=Nymphaea colorata TaxID=210225 RepID=UPI00129DD5D7|nr:putative pentatricopeptide repeat-containing protein At1g02420 [Nymphaea colorata]
MYKYLKESGMTVKTCARSMSSILFSNSVRDIFASLSWSPHAFSSFRSNSHCNGFNASFASHFSLFCTSEVVGHQDGSSEKGTHLIHRKSEADAIYEIICKSKVSDQNELGRLLKESGIFLSNQLVDEVLRKARFGHCNGLQVLEFFSLAGRRRGFFHSADSYDNMLYILGRMRQFDKLWGLLKEMRRKDCSLITTRTMQVVLARIAKVCSVRTTVESFNRFRKYYPGEFDTDCFNALIRTLCQEKRMDDARNVFHNLKHEFRPNLHTFNILLSGWKTVEEAESFFKEMTQLGCRPDIVSYNCLVDVLCKNKEMEKAYKTLAEMREMEIYPDLLTYTSIVGGLGLVGQPDKACDILKEMQEHGCGPDAAAYNAAIRNFCIARRLGDAYTLLDEMVEKGVSPNATTYNLFFRCFYWSNNLSSAWILYQRMMRTGFLPHIQSCMFLVKMFRRQEKAEMGLTLWNDMIERGFGSCILVSDILFDMLCDLGRLLDLERCFLQMLDMGLKPSNVSFKRMKVLMELANHTEGLRKPTEKMESLGQQAFAQL